jgi:hypothetical protein
MLRVILDGGVACTTGMPDVVVTTDLPHVRSRDVTNDADD